MPLEGELDEGRSRGMRPFRLDMGGSDPSGMPPSPGEDTDGTTAAPPPPVRDVEETATPRS